MKPASYIRAIRGPVMLIGLGVAMLVDHFGRVTFWQSWPALLILFGLMVLAERIFSRPGGASPDGTQPGGTRA
jgi:hypothetical protein